MTPASRAVVTRFFSEWPVSMMIGDVRIGVGARLADHLRELEPVEDRHGPVGDHDVGDVMGEGFQAGGAVFRLVDFARAEAVQQRAQIRRIWALSSMTRKRRRLKSMRTMLPGSRAPGARYRRFQASRASLRKGLG